MSDDALSIHRVAGGTMARRAVALLSEALEAGGATSDLAVLARVNSALLPVQVALTEAGVLHTAPLDAAVLQRTGVRTALAYLRLGLDTDRLRRDDVLDTLNRPARKVKSAVTPHLPRGSRWSLRALQQVCDQLDGTHRERFAGYLDDLRHLEAEITDGADTARCLWVIRNRIGLGEAMDALDASRTRPEGSSHGDDLDALEQLAGLQPEPATFAEWLAQRLKVPGEPSGVTLSTVHRVKGMEWPTVVVFAANQGLFPHRLADDLEEERRVFHVAITRCVRSVTIVADEQRTSAFVDELRTAAAEPSTSNAQPVALSPPARPASRTADARVLAEIGVTVTVTGGLTGRIVEVDGDGVTVAVPDGIAATDDPNVSDASPTAAILLRVGFEEPVVVDGDAVRLARTRRSTAATSPSGAATAEASDPELFARLRTWRARTAATAGVPAFLVFHDSHLQTIAERKPRTLRQLAACPGVGPAKLDRYADDLLDLIEDHLVGAEPDSG